MQICTRKVQSSVRLLIEKWPQNTPILCDIDYPFEAKLSSHLSETTELCACAIRWPTEIDFRRKRVRSSLVRSERCLSQRKHSANLSISLRQVASKKSGRERKLSERNLIDSHFDGCKSSMGLSAKSKANSLSESESVAFTSHISHSRAET